MVANTVSLGKSAGDCVLSAANNCEDRSGIFPTYLGRRPGEAYPSRVGVKSCEMCFTQRQGPIGRSKVALRLWMRRDESSAQLDQQFLCPPKVRCIEPLREAVINRLESRYGSVEMSVAALYLGQLRGRV